MCKKTKNKRHCLTVLQKTEIISLNAGLRLDGLLALHLWDLVIDVLRSSNSTKTPTNPEAGNYSCDHKSKPIQKENRDDDQFSHVDYVTTNANSSQGVSQLYIFEDNEAVIKMTIKGRSPTMRHVSRTHKVALDWLFDWITLDFKIQIKYVDTINQLADILTKGSFTRDEWKHLLELLNINNFSMLSCSHFIPKGKHSVCPKESRIELLRKVWQWRNEDRWVWQQEASWARRSKSNMLTP